MCMPDNRCCYLGMEAAIIVGLQEELATERDTEPEEVDPGKIIFRFVL